MELYRQQLEQQPTELSVRMITEFSVLPHILVLWLALPTAMVIMSTILHPLQSAMYAIARQINGIFTLCYLSHSSNSLMKTIP
jgi:hypothetical protein